MMEPTAIPHTTVVTRPPEVIRSPLPPFIRESPKPMARKSASANRLWVAQWWPVADFIDAMTAGTLSFATTSRALTTLVIAREIPNDTVALERPSSLGFLTGLSMDYPSWFWLRNHLSRSATLTPMPIIAPKESATSASATTRPDVHRTTARADLLEAKLPFAAIGR